MLGFRDWRDARGKYTQIVNAQQEVERLQNQYNRKMSAAERKLKLVGKIEEARPGEWRMLTILNSLSRNLPSGSWLTALQSNGSQINLTILSPDGTDGFIGKLEDQCRLKIKNLQKNQGADGKYIMSLTLESSTRSQNE